MSEHEGERRGKGENFFSYVRLLTLDNYLISLVKQERIEWKSFSWNWREKGRDVVASCEDVVAIGDELRHWEEFCDDLVMFWRWNESEKRDEQFWW